MLPDLSAVDLPSILHNLALLVLAGLVALPIAWEREQADRPAGLRTFPVVAVASCAFVLIGIRIFPGSEEPQARVIQGLMTGIGFVGGGVILQRVTDRGDHVTGIATAASIWNTGAMGAAVAYRLFDVALALSLLNYLILRFIKPATGQEDAVEVHRDER